MPKYIVTLIIKRIPKQIFFLRKGVTNSLNKKFAKRGQQIRYIENSPKGAKKFVK